MDSPAEFDEGELITLIDRIVRCLPGISGGNAIVRKLTNKQERLRGGYDAAVVTVLPFYVQVKTATFHPVASKSSIVSDRERIGLNIRPGAFSFPLRKHRGSDEPLQHNALYWLSLREIAAYVLPTFVTEKTLDKKLQRALSLKRSEIWKYTSVDYVEISTGLKMAIQARHFNGLFTIVPHRLVKDTGHRYSFDKNVAPHVAFHSDPEDVGETISLVQFMNKVLSRLDQEDSLTTSDLKDRLLNYFYLAFFDDNGSLKLTARDVIHQIRSSDFSRSNTSVDLIFAYLSELDWHDLAAIWGGCLKDKFQIRQYLAFQILE